MTTKRWASGLTAALVTVTGLVATAYAATPKNALKVTGPYAVAYKAPYQITTSGYAIAPANEVVAWRTKAACATSYSGELKAEGTTAPAWQSAVSGKFSHKQSYVGATKTGQTVYYWCAYLINKSTKSTVKFKYWKWSELGSGGGPGGP